MVYSKSATLLEGNLVDAWMECLFLPAPNKNTVRFRRECGAAAQRLPISLELDVDLAERVGKLRGDTRRLAQVRGHTHRHA